MLDVTTRATNKYLLDTQDTRLQYTPNKCFVDEIFSSVECEPCCVSIIRKQGNGSDRCTVKLFSLECSTYKKKMPILHPIFQGHMTSFHLLLMMQCSANGMSWKLLHRGGLHSIAACPDAFAIVKQCSAWPLMWEFEQVLLLRSKALSSVPHNCNSHHFLLSNCGTIKATEHSCPYWSRIPRLCKLVPRTVRWRPKELQKCSDINKKITCATSTTIMSIPHVRNEAAHKRTKARRERKGPFIWTSD